MRLPHRLRLKPAPRLRPRTSPLPSSPSSYTALSGPGFTMADDRFLVVGLGNPGPRYAATRHNIGFAVVELLALRAGAKFKAHKSRCEIAEVRLAGQSVVLAKPLSYMNESGGPVVG